MNDSPLFESIERRMQLLAQQVQEWKALLQREKQTHQAIVNRYEDQLTQAGDDVFRKSAVMAQRAYTFLQLRKANLAQRAWLKRCHEQQTTALERELTLGSPT